MKKSNLSGGTCAGSRKACRETPATHAGGETQSSQSAQNLSPTEGEQWTEETVLNIRSSRGDISDQQCIADAHNAKVASLTARLQEAERDATAWRLVASGKEKAYVAMEKEVKWLKGELAYMKLQRDRLLEITWLDLPAEPSESTTQWQEQFNKAWVRRESLRTSLDSAEKVIEEMRKALIEHDAWHYGLQEYPESRLGALTKSALALKPTSSEQKDEGEKEP